MSEGKPRSRRGRPEHPLGVGTMRTMTSVISGLLLPSLRCPDYTCSYFLARTYFQKLAAPSKGFYSFKDSAHSPIFEEPGRVQRIVREDILPGRTTLSDSCPP